jgi:hypothetical protein
VSPGLQFILATRHLERIADHATNIAEDIIFWVRGLDVRHGRALLVRAGGAQDSGDAQNPGFPEVTDPAGAPEGVMENSHALHSRVTGARETERA